MVSTGLQQPAGKSMSRMVRIPTTNASAFYGGFPSANDSAAKFWPQSPFRAEKNVVYRHASVTYPVMDGIW